MAKEPINMLMEISLKENGKMMKNKLANIFLEPEMNSKADLEMGRWLLE